MDTEAAPAASPAAGTQANRPANEFSGSPLDCTEKWERRRADVLSAQISRPFVDSIQVREHAKVK